VTVRLFCLCLLSPLAACQFEKSDSDDEETDEGVPGADGVAPPEEGGGDGGGDEGGSGGGGGDTPPDEPDVVEPEPATELSGVASMYLVAFDCSASWEVIGWGTSCDGCDLAFESELWLVEDTCGDLAESAAGLLWTTDDRLYFESSYWGRIERDDGWLEWRTVEHYDSDPVPYLFSGWAAY